MIPGSKALSYDMKHQRYPHKIRKERIKLSINKRKIGSCHEEQAAAFLKKQGLYIVERNFRCKSGEIDIIAENREYLVFAEVKLRKSTYFGAAREFVDARKQKKLRATASMWLEEHETSLQPRFDVIEIYAPDGMQTKSPQIRQIEDAFI